MQTTPAFEITPRTAAPAVRLDPRWNKARELLAQFRQTAEAFAEEIERLRELYLNQGHGGDRRLKNPAPEDAEQGFQAAVERELGIGKSTAYRYISVVKAIGYCEQIEHAPKGEIIELPGAGSYEVTPAVREKARQLREEIVTGGVPMNRAMPAVAGMFGVAGGGMGGKAATNHGANVWSGLTKLLTSLSPKHWRKGEVSAGRDWDDAVNAWARVLEQLPDELKRETAEWAKKQGGRK